MKYISLCFKQLSYGFGALVFATALIIGCDSSTGVDESKPQIVDALIQFDGSDEEATFEVGETVKFIGFAVTESGDRIPLSDLNENWSWKWESTASDVFTVDTDGSATGEGEGEAFCVLTLEGSDDETAISSAKQDNSTLLHGANEPFRLQGVFVGRDSLVVMLF